MPFTQPDLTPVQPRPHYLPGEPIAIREHWQERIWTVRPVTVVIDTTDYIALYMAPGTVYLHPRTPSGDPVPYFLPDEWRLVQREWTGGGALYLTQPGAWWVVMGFFDEHHHQIERWYVNLQTPYQRSNVGFDYLDLELDLLVNRELTQWTWKDEAAFLDAQQRGRITAAQADQVRRTGAEIVAQLAAGAFRPPADWAAWRPASQGQCPPIPAHWASLSTPSLPPASERISETHV